MQPSKFGLQNKKEEQKEVSDSDSSDCHHESYINHFKTLKSNDNFGINFILKSKDSKNLYKSLYDAQCKSNCYLATLSMKAFEKIKDRIEKKRQMQELNLLRQVYQFNKMTKRILKSILMNQKVVHMKRNQVLIREGDSKKQIFVVKQGQFQITKNVMMPKQSDLAYQ